MKIYLDIDGVLLTRNHEMPDHLEAFLDFVTQNFDCYWLTTHCRTGENKAISYLSQFYPKSLLQKLECIQPSDWDTKKTEAIDFSSPFLWLDDHPFEAERQDLIRHNCIENLWVVDLQLNNELLELREELKKLSV